MAEILFSQIIGLILLLYMVSVGFAMIGSKSLAAKVARLPIKIVKALLKFSWRTIKRQYRKLNRICMRRWPMQTRIAKVTILIVVILLLIS
jgi:flagellar motor component MotA